MQTVVEGLQVNVGGAQVGDAANDLIDHADHGRLAGEVFEVFDKVARVEIKTRGIFVFYYLIAGGQRPVDLRLQGDARVNRQTGGQCQGFEKESIVGNRHGHGEVAVIDAQGVHMVVTQELTLQAFDLRCEVGEVIG